MVKYEGIFLDEESVKIVKENEGKKLKDHNDEIHITFKYMPSDDEIFDELVGKEYTLYLVGYENDGMNSGFEVMLGEELKKYFINYDEDTGLLKTPHITVSMAEGAKAYKTKDLKFKKLDSPIKVTGIFGYWISEDDREYISFNKYKA